MKTIELEIDDNDLIVNKGLDALELLLPILKNSITVEKRKNRKGAATLKNTRKPKYDYDAELRKLTSDEDLIQSFLQSGKDTKRSKTKIGLEDFIRECDRHNLPYEKAMRIMIIKTWRGFDYSWLKPEDFIKFGIVKTKAKAVEKSKPEQPKPEPISKEAAAEQAKKAAKEINETYAKFKASGFLPVNTVWMYEALVHWELIKTSGSKEIDNYFNLKREEAKQQLETSKKSNTQTVGRVLKTILVDKVDIEVKMKRIVLTEFFEKKKLKGLEKIFDI